MRFSLSLTALAVLSMLTIVADAAPPFAVVVAGTDVGRAVSQLSPQFTDDEPLRVLDAGANRLGLFVVGRPKRTGPEQVAQDGAVAVTEGLQLDQVSAIVQVLSGAGEFVTGGTLVAPIRMPPNDPDAAVIGPGTRGEAILGGERRRIAIELNERGVPSPGAAWKRKTRRRDGKWLDSTINGNILDNPLYAGEVIYNRVSMPHAEQDSAIRFKRPQPEAAWIRRHDEALRIVPQPLWDRVRARRQNLPAGNRVILKRGRKPGSRGGRALRWPLSGLLVLAVVVA
jgi:hypothetical protein